MIIEVLNVEDFKASTIKSTKNRPRIGSVFLIRNQTKMSA